MESGDRFGGPRKHSGFPSVETLWKRPKSYPPGYLMEASLHNHDRLTTSLAIGWFNLLHSPLWGETKISKPLIPWFILLVTRCPPPHLVWVQKWHSLTIRRPFQLCGSEAFLGTVDEDQIYLRHVFGHLNGQNLYSLGYITDTILKICVVHFWYIIRT